MSKALVVQTTLSAKELERLDRLRRRCKWLKRRIANHHGNPGFDKSEFSAREWAIRFIKDAKRGSENQWTNQPLPSLSSFSSD